MTDVARGELIVRFEADPDEERVHARVRMVCAGIASVASLAVMLGRVPVTVFLVALLGLAISLAWFREARKAARRATTPQAVFLEVYRGGLVWAEAPNPPIWVSWNEVSALDVDEERLTVCVSRAAAPPLHIIPRYPGVEIHALVDRLRNAFQEASDNLDD